MTCQSCAHFLKQTDDQGLCRRYPPIVLINFNGPHYSVFPPMQNEGCCGEHKEKQNA